MRAGLALAVSILGCVFSRGAANEGAIAITSATEGPNTVEFTFASTWPAGTSYQPQFQRNVGSAWMDLPDARIEEVEETPGEFRASAPRFGGASGFYRVLNARSQADDPAAATIEDPAPEELFLLWSRTVPQPEGGSATEYSSKVLFHVEAPAGGPVSSTFSTNATGRLSPNGSASPAQDTLMSDLDGDGRVEPLLVWTDANNRMVLSIAEVDPANLTVTQRATFPVADHVVRAEGSVPPLVRVQRAHFPGVTNPRIWLAWVNTAREVQIELLELRANLTELVSLAGFTLPDGVAYEAGDLQERSGWFDIAAGDFDGDGADELAVVTTRNAAVPNGLSNWELYVRFFKYSADAPAAIRGDALAEPDRRLYLKDGRTSIWLSRLAGHAADFDGDGRDELAVVYETADNSSFGRWYLQFLKPDVAFGSLARRPAQPEQIDQTSGNHGYPLDLQTGEFDGDPLPELVIGWRQIRVYDIRPDFGWSSLASSDGFGSESEDTARRFIMLANLNSTDPNYGSRPEIVAVTDQRFEGGSQRRFVVQSFTVTGDASSFYRMREDARLLDEVAGQARRFTAIGTADFGKNGPRLGTPRRYTRTVSGKPVVIVNAPPVHFDVLEGVPYDVNNMFPTLDCINSVSLCPFYSRYTVASTTSIEVETEWERGWNVGVKVKGGVELPLDIGLKAEIQTKFSERFDSFASTRETTKVEVQVDAVADDRVYAATIDYTVWEYPVVVDGRIATYIIAYAPEVARQNWFGSKSVVAQNYRPYHEIGNLLSYRSAREPYPGAEYVRSIESADTFTVDSSSAYLWRLTRTSTATTRENRSFNFSIQAKASFDIPFPWIPDVTVTGGYDSTSLTASTTELTDQQGLIATLGALDGRIAGTGYSITPYFYWDRSGALVLDYAVDLPTGTAGQPTFWSRNYTALSDPAFVLPWRLDPEKGLAVLNAAQLQLTREIATVPPEPRPGDDVELVARISNFSFLATPSSFRVRFYLGDPLNGGQLLVSREGFDHVLVPAGVPARGKRLVQFPWRIPASAASVSIPIYCVIDPDDQLDEIHEDNNLGWNEIFLRHGP